MSALFIALEGIDGSGKGTQAALLKDRLIAAGLRTALLSFPRYQQTEFGRQIGRFLNGEFGGLDEVDPLLASLLFAGDRFESRSLLRESLAAHDVVVCDRYVASNIAHQAAKRSGAERAALIDWIEHLEFGLYELPRPQLTIWLDLPVTQAQELIARKTKRTYTDKAADLQEADGDYLEQVRAVYATLAERDPTWRRIDCLAPVSRDAEASVAERSFRDVDDIAREIFQIIHEIANIPRSASSTFLDLVSSRKAWLADTLQPWCRTATRKELLLAEQEWTDIAGKVDPEMTLWRWAWSRFPGLVHESLGIEETTEIVVTLASGQEIRGFPDARQSLRGQLVVLTSGASGRFANAGPFSLDDVRSVHRCATIDPMPRGVP